MTIDTSSSFNNEFYSSDVSTTFLAAAENVAERLGTDYETLFGDTAAEDRTVKVGGSITVQDATSADVVWWNGKNDVFAENFIKIFNEELLALNNDITFAESENPFLPPEDNSSFDLRVGTFLLLVQTIGGHITNEKSTNMYFYLTRNGLLPSAFWLFQYVFWMAISSVTIGITALFGFLVGAEIEVGPYFVGAWFHIAFAVLLGSVLKNKKFVNMTSFFLLIGGFAIPIVFASIDQTETNKQIYNGFRCVPVFFFMGNVTPYQIKVGLAICAGLTALAAYLAPLFTVSDGMYVGGKVNYLYFLTPSFWREGIVALPSHEESIAPIVSDEGGFDLDTHHEGIQFNNCVKKFGEDKVIGPMNLHLKPGKITTLLGPNGVGKSTLMKVAAGYFIPSDGEMILEGKNIFREHPWSCLESISFCPQDNYIYDNMTVEEHMLLISSIRDMSRLDGDLKSHIDWILTTLDIEYKRTTLAKNLSGGMKRRLCLAMSILGFPRVILCDEPSSGVDSVSQRGVWKVLETAKKKSAILLTSHTSLEAMILSDSVVLMKSSEDITQTNGIQSMAFSLKDVEENTTTEYDVNSSNAHEVANIIASLPNDGSEWKIASKRLNPEAVPPLEDVLQGSKENDSHLGEIPESEVAPRTIPETFSSGSPSTWRQIYTLLSIIPLYIDRMFFIVVFALPLNGAQIWLANALPGFGPIAVLILTPLIPMIALIIITISCVQMTEILATERDLGISKLLFSSGITRFAYLSSYLLLYFILSFPVSVSFLLAVATENGTAAGMVAIFFMFLSCQFLVMGFCVGLGAVLDPRTAFITTLILPSLFAIYGQGALTPLFANTYPGAVGQVMAGLLIDNVNRTEWILYGVSLVINIFIGALGFYIFMLRLGNYNVFSKLCSKDKGEKYTDVAGEEYDVENNVHVHDDNVFLEGKSIVKVYGVGERDTSSFRALDDVTFAVTKGSLLGLVGKSGAGKSTLMDVLAGQLNVTSGTVFVEGEQVLPADISKVVSMCGQLDTIWPDMKVINAIMIFMKCRGYSINPCATKIQDPYVTYLIEELGMEEMLNKRAKVLSGGQKRRLAFLVSLIGDTKVVLVDEAMTGVDIDTRKVMWKILQDEVSLRGRSVVVTSHEMAEIEQYCNTVGVLHDGKLVEMGRLEEIKKKWSDSVKLICLFSSVGSVSRVENMIIQNHPAIVVQSPHVDVLDEPDETRIVATYAINLVDIGNISGLIHTMNGGIDDPSLLYWSIEPQSLDDFVRSKSKLTIV